VLNEKTRLATGSRVIFYFSIAIGVELIRHADLPCLEEDACIWDLTRFRGLQKRQRLSGVYAFATRGTCEAVRLLAFATRG
jgi:hypothetical protein